MLKFIQGKNHLNLRDCHCLDIHDKPIQHIKALPLTHSNKIILESSQNFAAANLFFFPFFSPRGDLLVSHQQFGL